MSRRYFGTDGIRGRVGEGAMQADFVLRLGRAAGRVLCPDGGTVVIGKDTRVSGYLFEAALEAGFASAGVDVLMLGPLPTPGIAFITQDRAAAAGIVISASHNPHEDNGLKFFSATGAKLDDAIEEAIEAELERPFATVPPGRLGRARRLEDAAVRYVEFCKRSLDGAPRLDGLHIVLDCAHGATYKVAPAVFSELGARVDAIGVRPDGTNINRDHGSTNPAALQREVVACGADLGIAFDGDGDRVVMVGADGTLYDGDDLLYVIAAARIADGGLRGPVVGTLMSNLGLERAITALGAGFERTKVGDRHVLARLLETGGELGGESSGHILCLDRATTGDGIVSALQVLRAVAASGRGLGELLTPMTKLPQKMINVRCDTRPDLDAAPVLAAVKAAEDALAGRGRVLLRASGTEPVVRVMVEGDDGAEVERVCEHLADAVTAVCAGPDRPV